MKNLMNVDALSHKALTDMAYVKLANLKTVFNAINLHSLAQSVRHLS